MDNCIQKICEIRDYLSQTERRIADAILQNPKKVCLYTVTELAEYCDSSPATITRMCKLLGYQGYKDFIKCLILDLSTYTDKDTINDDYQEVNSTDDIKTVVTKVVANNVLAIKNTFQILDLEKVNQAINAICNAQRLHFYAVGGSSIAAIDAEYRFMRLGKDVHAYTSDHEQIYACSTLNKNDVAIFISYSGETKDIINVANICKKSGVKTISITRFSNNTLSQLVDISLKTTSFGNSVRSFASGAQIAQLNMIDIIYSAVAAIQHDKLEQWFERTEEIINLGKNRR